MTDAAVVAGAGAVLLAALPPGAGVAFRAGLVLIASVCLILVAGAGAGSFATVASLLGLTLSPAFTDPAFGGLTGRRLRIARLLPAALIAASLSALLASDLFVAVASLAACALLASVAAGCTRGETAALAAWALLRLQVVAIGGALLGVALLPVSPPAGAGLILLGAAALGGAAPFGGALAQAEAAAPPPLAALSAGLLPLTGLALVLRARLLLVHDGYGPAADAALVASGLLALLLGAALAWAHADRERDEAAARGGLLGLSLLGFGLGGVAGLHAGLLCLLALVFASPAAFLARHEPNGRLRRATELAASGVPLSGLFAGIVLLIEAARLLALPAVPPLLLLLAGLARPRGAMARTQTGRGTRAALGAHLLISVIIGLALPEPVASRLLSVAAAFSGTP